MTIKTTTEKQLCAVCGGELRETTITHEERRGDNLLNDLRTTAEQAKETKKRRGFDATAPVRVISLVV